MTSLDAIIAQGLKVVDRLSGEPFRLRETDRTGNINEGETTKEETRGGYKNVRRMTIVYARANGDFAPVVNVGETICARGLQMKITRILTDPTTHTFECSNFDA